MCIWFDRARRRELGGGKKGEVLGADALPARLVGRSFVRALVCAREAEVWVWLRGLDAGPACVELCPHAGGEVSSTWLLSDNLGHGEGVEGTIAEVSEAVTRSRSLGAVGMECPWCVFQMLLLGQPRWQTYRLDSAQLCLGMKRNGFRGISADRAAMGRASVGEILRARGKRLLDGQWALRGQTGCWRPGFRRTKQNQRWKSTGKW